ncbi:LysR family transcriptional regulator [Undibacterium sp. TJN19]|uniref:LysR family transcriptional regulator n=1 Tax=Undibacterium sp. TJN19 TaxID=3413055 RepID=UPI003BF388CF
MQWDDLRYFLALARHGSLSATARQLAIEHTTVARRVSSLEQALGLKLFDRLPRGWALTAEGETIYERACLLEDDMQALQRTALGQSALAGRVRLSAPPQLLNYFVLPHMDEFRVSCPQIELELSAERRGVHLGRGEADIALRISEPQEPDLVARKLGHINYGLYGTAACCILPEAERKFIGFDDSMPGLLQKLWMDTHAGTRPFVLRAKDMTTMCQAAAQGWGIALLPRFLATKDARLQLLDVAVQAPSLPIYLVMHADVRRAPRVRSTADYLVGLFATHAAEL